MYLALYRKYRPRTFGDVLGQPHITKTLQNEVMAGRTAHAYLFTGPRGTGKTTCSKILAQAVNCLHPVEGDPCFDCENCRAIDQGSTLDVVEIDAASNNGVDNIRDLRDEANYMPSQCQYRVYIIDEAHMLSPGAFNALLKIMEEPPEHVKFILATTEAHKVPATILSRCQRFDFKRIRAADIQSRLLSIAKQENLTLEPAAAELIARLADGGMRDALSLLDHCAGFSSEITFASAVETIGLVDRSYLFDLTDCILEQNPARAVREIDRLYTMSKDMQALLEELLSHFRDLMLFLTLENPEDLVAALPEERARLRECAGRFTMPAVLRAMGILQEAIDRMGRNFDRRMTLELCLIRLCSPPTNDASPDALAARLARLEGLLANSLARPPASPTQAIPAAPAPAPIASGPTATAPERAAEPAVLAERSAPPPDAAAPVPLPQWGDVLRELMETCPALYGVLRDSRAFAGGGNLYIDSTNALAGKMIKQEGNAARLLAAAERQTGERYKIRVKAAAPSPGVPDALSALLDKARESGVEVRIENRE